MKSDIYTKVMLAIIAVLLAVLCIQGTMIRKVEIYFRGNPIGGKRRTSFNALPVDVMNRQPIPVLRHED